MVDLIRKDATSTVGGELTNGAQTIAGAKTFTGATTFSSTLTPSGGVVGRTNGVAVPAGQIGETITSANIVTTTLASLSDTDITNATITLTPGVWRITYQLTCQMLTASATNDGGSIYVAMTDNSNNRIARTNRSMFVRNTGAGTQTPAATCLAMDIVISLSVTTTYKLRGQRADNQGVNTATVQVNANQNDSVFFAVRIA